MSTDPIICSVCGKPTHWLEVFPGNKCLGCYAKEQEETPLPTAKELADMFRQAVNAK